MIRKAWALVMSAIICCSLYAVDPGVSYAVEGVCSGVASALLSASSDPRVSLQGVTVADGAWGGPDSISFVRSDVASYWPSLRFFSSGDRSDYLDSILSMLTSALGWEADAIPSDIKEGDIILDGVVRLVPGERIAVSVSMLITGTLFPDSMVIEGDFSVALNEGGITIRTEDVMINGARYVAPDISLPIPVVGG